MTAWRVVLRRWAPDVLLAVAMWTVGMLEASRGREPGYAWGDLTPVVTGMAIAVGLSRRAPGVAVAAVWLMGLLQLATHTPVLLSQLAIAFVVFGAARWGSRAVVLLSGLSVPLGALVVVTFGASEVYGALASVIDYNSVILSAYRFGASWQVAAGLLGLFVLGSPWLAGLVLRYSARAEASQRSQRAAEEDTARAQRESAQAQEIARLREEQAGLARDVHDVVGHSLAVILAQAESARYLTAPDDAALAETLRGTLATIATSARGSLTDVREVLTVTTGGAGAAGAAGADAPSREGSLDSLVEGVGASGHEVRSRVDGRPRPLPPDLETVAYRVLQEMLTNALKHGARGAPVTIERQWGGDLRMSVSNQMPPGDGDLRDRRPALPPDAGGLGLPGMRRRLAAVGGHLHVDLPADGLEATFTATAWIPLRGQR